MVYDKQKYQNLINESKLFSLDKETESIAFRRESFKMVEYLYCYLLAVNEAAYVPYGSEIMNVATRCINNFDVSKGIFLHYFNAAWKQEYSHLCSDAIIDEKLRGMKTTEEERRSIVKYFRYIDKLPQSMSREERLNIVAEAMGIPYEKVAEIALLSGTLVVSNISVNEDGDEIDLLDQLSDTQLTDPMESEESVIQFLQIISEVFESLQTRQRGIISDMLTVKILPVLLDLNISKDGYDFISDYVVEEYATTGTMPSQRQIADKHNRDEASISRSIKQFLIKLKQYEK